MTAREVLIRAVEAIEREGWGQLGSMARKHCAITALDQCDDWEASSEAVDALYQELFGDAVPNVCKAHSIAMWNDAPSRTKEEVTSAILNAKRWL